MTSPPITPTVVTRETSYRRGCLASLITDTQPPSWVSPLLDAGSMGESVEPV